MFDRISTAVTIRKSQFAVMALIVSFYLRFAESLRSGRAGSEPLYDDITYLLDGRSRFYLWHWEHWSSLSNWLIDPPHSPSSSMISFLGYALSDGTPQNAQFFIYLINGLLIEAILVVLFFLTFGNLFKALVATSTLNLTTLAPTLLFEFRPDPLFSIYLALMMVIVYKFGDLKRIPFWFPLISAISVLIKPTFIIFAVTTFVFLVFVLLVKQERRSHAVLQLVKGSLLAILVLLPYLISSWSHFYQYIYAATIGQQSSIWDAEDFAAGISINFKAIWTNFGLGITFLAFAALFTTIFFLLPKSKSNSQLFWLAMIPSSNLLVAFATLGATRFFYLPALLTMFFAFALGSKYIRNYPHPTGMKLIAVFLLLFTFGPNPNPQPTLSKIQSGINEEISQLLLKGEYKSVIFFFAAQANSSTVSWYMTDPESVPSFNSLVLTTEPENRVSEILNLARSYDAAVFATSEMPGLQAQPPVIFPIHALQDELLAELETIWGTPRTIQKPEYTILVNPKFD